MCGQEDVLHLRAVPGIPGCCEGLKCVGPPGPFLRDKQGTQPSWVGSPGSQTLAAEMSAATPPAFNVHFAFGDDAAYDKKTKGGSLDVGGITLKVSLPFFKAITSPLAILHCGNSISCLWVCGQQGVARAVSSLQAQVTAAAALLRRLLLPQWASPAPPECGA